MQTNPHTWFGLVLGGVGVVTMLEKQSTFSTNITSPELKCDPSSLKNRIFIFIQSQTRVRDVIPSSDAEIMGAGGKSLS